MQVLNRKLNADRDVRKHTRLEIALPIHIVGRNSMGVDFQESNITIDISRNGLSTTLRTFSGQKTIVYLSVAMPNFLREYAYEEDQIYNIYAEVRYIRRLYTNAWRIGVQFIGTTPPPNCEHYPEMLQNYLSSIQQSILKAKKIF